MAALCTSDAFAAGTSLYGVTDLAALARDTHKFESRYLDGLVGPWPEAADVYAARSPITLLDGLATPVLVLQGADDMVVPPSQAEAVVAAVAAKGLPHAQHLHFGADAREQRPPPQRGGGRAGLRSDPEVADDVG